MPKAGIYLKQATYNEDAALKAAQSGCSDWAVTMCFYAALHYVKAYEAFNGDNIYEDYKTEPNQHERILSYVYDLDNTADSSVYAAYETLLEASKQARYLRGIETSARKHFWNRSDKYLKALSVVKLFFKSLLAIP
jgi:hypothetical protein